MRKLLAIAVVFLLLLGALRASAKIEQSTAPLRIFFLDVGQGDATLLRTREGDILIDAGGEGHEQLLCSRLRDLGVKSLRLAVFTHFDEDHIGGADAVLRQFSTREAWIPYSVSESESAERLLLAAKQTNTPLTKVCTGAMTRIGETAFSVMHPFTKQAANKNASSLVLRVQYGSAVALFMGDAGAAEERGLIDLYGKSQLNADLCKIGHHGSDTSTSTAFLQCVQPSYAVISCGAGNINGHPHGRVLSALDACGAVVLRTDLQGDIVFETDGKELYPILNP